MWTSTSLCAPYNSVSEILAAVDERYEDPLLHSDLERYLESGELPRELPMWEDALLPSFKRKVIHMVATNQFRAHQAFLELGRRYRRNTVTCPHGVTPKKDCRPCRLVDSARWNATRREKKLAQRDGAIERKEKSE